MESSVEVFVVSSVCEPVVDVLVVLSVSELSVDSFEVSSWLLPDEFADELENISVEESDELVEPAK